MPAHTVPMRTPTKHFEREARLVYAFQTAGRGRSARSVIDQRGYQVEQHSVFGPVSAISQEFSDGRVGYLSPGA